MNWFKRNNPLKQPSYYDLIERELQEAREALLRSETALDWAESNVDYNINRITRLEGRLRELQPKLQPGA